VTPKNGSLPTGWSLEAYVAHNEAMRTADRRFQKERDRRYGERDEANKAAVKAALASAERAGEKTEVALKEYKASANEWRDTVKDLVADMPTLRDFRTLEATVLSLRDMQNLEAGKDKGMSASWALLLGAIGLVGTVVSIGVVLVTVILFLNKKPDPVYVPAPPGTTLPATPPASAPR
jgi:hypothetical protein